MSERTWMKEPCGLCPFARKGTLFLHPERASDFAHMAGNPYNDFVCHKTGEDYEDFDGSSYIGRGQKSLTCCGFLSLQVSENGNAPEGFEPHPDAFSDTYEMIETHEYEWERQHGDGWRHENDDEDEDDDALRRSRMMLTEDEIVEIGARAICQRNGVFEIKANAEMDMRAVLAALHDAGLVLEQGWRFDMENAPRDGTPVLAWGCIHIDGWETGEWPSMHVTNYSAAHGGWVTPDLGSWEPVAYRLLPAPPTERKGAAP